MKKLYVVNMLFFAFMSGLCVTGLICFFVSLFGEAGFVWTFLLLVLFSGTCSASIAVTNWKTSKQLGTLDSENKYLAQSVEFSQRHDEALDLIDNYGGIDDGHHKQWVLDQVVRKLTGSEGSYNAWVQTRKDEDYGWEEGIAP